MTTLDKRDDNMNLPIIVSKSLEVEFPEYGVHVVGEYFASGGNSKIFLCSFNTVVTDKLFTF